MPRAAHALAFLLLANSAVTWADGPGPLAVLLVPFDASRLAADERWIGDGVAEITSLGLVQHPRIVQIDRARISAAQAWDEETVRLTARSLGADAASSSSSRGC
jgi:hypothetical protein